MPDPCGVPNPAVAIPAALCLTNQLEGYSQNFESPSWDVWQQD